MNAPFFFQKKDRSRATPCGIPMDKLLVEREGHQQSVRKVVGCKVSLPYGPIMRGLAVSWCYDRVEEGLTSLENPSKAAVFAVSSRVMARESLDPRAITLLQSPTAVLHVGQIVLSNARGYGASEVIYRNGDGSIEIEHPVPPGGTEDVDIVNSSRSLGKAKYVVEITETGIIGNQSTPGSYKLHQYKWMGSEWGAETVLSRGSIPDSGEIYVGDGSCFVFSTSGSNVVVDDTYSWEPEDFSDGEGQIVFDPDPPSGTQDVELRLSTSHSGNNEYTIEITADGTIGNETTPGEYALTRTPWTGSEWGTAVPVSSGSISLNGVIDVENGTFFRFFTPGSSVVDGDTYTWETEAYRVTNQTIRDAVVPIEAQITGATEEEVVGTGGYLDQLMLMFANKRFAQDLYDGHSEEVTEELTGMSVTSYVEGEQTLYRIDLTVKYTGKVFMASVSPLITLVVYDRFDIPTVP